MRRQVSEWSRRRHNFHDHLSFSSLLPIIFPKRGKAVSVHADCTDKSAAMVVESGATMGGLLLSPFSAAHSLVAEKADGTFDD